MSALPRRIVSKYEGDFYCLNCFHSFRTENKLKKLSNLCKNHGYCYVEIPKSSMNLTMEGSPFSFHGNSLAVRFLP